MKVETSTVKTEKFGNVGEGRHMTIDAASVQHIMKVLTNLYSDPYLAVIREYSTNAADSHILSKKTDTPIKVKLPSRNSPVFRVQDFGTGLSSEEVYEIYGSYGKSTKRETNELQGQLGFGCKSAFAVTGQFLVVAVKDGQEHTFSIHLDEDEMPTISELGSSITDKPNGFMVEIPISLGKIDDFNHKARDFYNFFSVPVELIDVTETRQISPFDPYKKQGLREITPNTFLLSYAEGQKSYVLMGGVRYPIDKDQIKDEELKRVLTFINCLIVAEIGDISFAPSREALRYNTKTIDFIHGKLDALLNAELDYYKKCLKEANEQGMISLIREVRRQEKTELFKFIHKYLVGYNTINNPIVTKLKTQVILAGEIREHRLGQDLPNISLRQKYEHDGVEFIPPVHPTIRTLDTGKYITFAGNSHRLHPFSAENYQHYARSLSFGAIYVIDDLQKKESNRLVSAALNFWANTHSSTIPSSVGDSVKKYNNFSSDLGGHSLYRSTAIVSQAELSFQYPEYCDLRFLQPLAEGYDIRLSEIVEAYKKTGQYQQYFVRDTSKRIKGEKDQYVFQTKKWIQGYSQLVNSLENVKVTPDEDDKFAYIVYDPENPGSTNECQHVLNMNNSKYLKGIQVYGVRVAKLEKLKEEYEEAIFIGEYVFEQLFRIHGTKEDIAKLLATLQMRSSFTTALFPDRSSGLYDHYKKHANAYAAQAKGVEDIMELAFLRRSHTGDEIQYLDTVLKALIRISYVPAKIKDEAQEIQNLAKKIAEEINEKYEELKYLSLSFDWNETDENRLRILLKMLQSFKKQGEQQNE